MLWERGWIDESKLSQYELVAKDDDGVVDLDRSLTMMMERNHDFETEVCQLEVISNHYGVVVMLSSKYHAEIAGCGIEYSWGAAKSRYRRISFEQKRSKVGFERAVNNALSVLGKATVRKCDREAFTSVLAYYSIEVLRAHTVGSDGVDAEGTTTEQGRQHRMRLCP